LKRKEHDPPAAINEWGWSYHHTGIPSQQPRKKEQYIPQYKMHVSGFPDSPYGIEWMRFEPDSPISKIVQTVPHVAFEGDDIELELKDKQVISKVCSPVKGIKVAMILHNGCPIELIQFSKNDFE
jgi:hypothetical protein